MTPVFRLTHADVVLDHRVVLRDVEFRLDPGEVVAVMGPNGSGKTTLVRALLGLVPLSAGRVELYGVPPSRFREWYRIGYVPQRLAAGGGVPATVREIVASGRVARQRRFRVSSTDDRRAIAQALATVGLSDRSRDAVHTLSGGQQQRVLIARALALEPDTFVFDEPAAGVDVENQQHLAATLRELLTRGRAALLIAHELGPLEPLITRAVCFSEGRVVHEGRPPRPSGEHARPGHDHVHPHADVEASHPLSPWGS